MTEPIKIHFQLEQDADGYPPVSVESVWAVKQGEGYRLDNVPFFIRAATLGDVVTAELRDGHLWFERVIQRSGNSLLRVILFEETSAEAIRQSLAELGCDAELLERYQLLAVNVPPGASLSAVQAYLAQQAATGCLDYEEPILRH